MGIRFRKSVSLGKGARVNFSKSGVSLNAGARGASVTLGRRGTYLNTSIPGTGIYARTKIDGSSNSTRKGSSYASGCEVDSALDTLLAHSINDADNGRQTLMKAAISEADGSVVFKYPDTDENITDPDVIKRIKRLPEYKNALPQIKAAQAKIWASLKESSEQTTDEFVNIYKLAPEVVSIDEVQDELAVLKPRVYMRQPFARPQPTEDEISEKLRQEAEMRVTPIIGKRKKRQAYFEEHHWNFTRSYMNQWDCERREHEAHEDTLEKQNNEEYWAAYVARRAELERFLVQDEESVSEGIRAWLQTITLPADTSVQFEYRDTGELFVDLNLPEVEDIPNTTTKTFKSGQTKVVNKTQKQIKEEYAKCVFGLAVFLSACLFNANANINLIVLSGYTQRRNKDGDIQDDYIYSVEIPRYTLEGEDISDPEEFFMSCENRVKMSQTYVFKAIEPYGMT